MPPRPGLTEKINLEENMKTKSFNKKLNLTKQTVAHLNSIELKQAKGGATGDTCILSLIVVCKTLDPINEICNPTYCDSFVTCCYPEG